MYTRRLLNIRVYRRMWTYHNYLRVKVQTGGSFELKNIKYQQAVAATSFFNERLSLVLGIRHDQQLNRRIGNISSSAPGTEAALDAHGIQKYGGYLPGTGTVVGVYNIGKASPITKNVGSVLWLDKGQRVGAFTPGPERGARQRLDHHSRD